MRKRVGLFMISYYLEMMIEIWFVYLFSQDGLIAGMIKPIVKPA